MQNKRRKAEALLLRGLVLLSIGITAAALLFLLLYILIKGLPHLSADLFTLHYTSENGSLVPALINTLSMTLLTLLIAVPLGIFSAIYLAEYARRGNKLVKAVRTTAETLAGIPSIVYGLFGYLLFVISLHWGYSLLAGACTLAIMILPVILRTAEEALQSVPDSYREGSFGLGAGKLRTVFRVILPSAMPGILAGIVLAVGRMIGETAALIYTAGTVPEITTGLTDSGRTLSVHMYALWSEGMQSEKSYATAVVLLLLTAGLNALSALIAGRITRKGGT